MPPKASAAAEHRPSDSRNSSISVHLAAGPQHHGYVALRRDLSEFQSACLAGP